MGNKWENVHVMACMEWSILKPDPQDQVTSDQFKCIPRLLSSTGLPSPRLHPHEDLQVVPISSPPTPLGLPQEEVWALA